MKRAQKGESAAGLIDKVFITGKVRHPELAAVAGTVIGWLKGKGRPFILDRELMLEEAGERASLAEAAGRVSLVVALGGDGTILGTVKKLAGLPIPILGVNLGGLGFLAETASGEVTEVLEAIAGGHCRLDERMMLDCRLERDGRLVGAYTVLNDVVVNKGALARIVGLEARLDGNYLTRYRGDGLIVSTPTGSTAYSMAAGGPIVYPQTEAILLTPICAHILANRPIVVPPGEEVSFILKSGDDVSLTLDGQEGVPLAIGDVIVIRRSGKRTTLVHAGSYNYYQVLRRKLKWGEW